MQKQSQTTIMDRSVVHGLGSREMVLVISILAVALVATVSGALAVPLGIFIGLHPFAVYGIATATAIAVTWGLLLGGDRLRAAIAKRLGRGKHTESRTRGLIERYGSPGLGLVGPIFPGVIVSAISGVAIGIDSKHLGRWLTVGIAAWFAVFTAIWWAALRGVVG